MVWRREMFKTYFLHFKTWIKIMVELLVGLSLFFCILNMYIHETEWTLGVGDGQGGLACCDLWGHKESDATEWLNSTELRSVILIRSLVFNILKGKCVQLKGKDLTYLLYLSKSEIFILLVSDTSDSALSLVKHLWSSYSVLESVLATWIYREDVSGP